MFDVLSKVSYKKRLTAIDNKKYLVQIFYRKRILWFCVKKSETGGLTSMNIYNLSFNGICKYGVYFSDNYINPLILIQNAFSDNVSIRETHIIMTKTFKVFVCV